MMDIDVYRVVAAAIDSATGEKEPPRRRLPGLKLIAAGAALAGAARVGRKYVPRMAKSGLSEADPEALRDLVGAVRDRFAGDSAPDDVGDTEDQFDRDEEDWDEEEDGGEGEPRGEQESGSEDEDEDSEEEPDEDEWDEGDEDEGDEDEGEEDEDDEDREDDDADDEDWEPGEESEQDGARAEADEGQGEDEGEGNVPAMSIGIEPGRSSAERSRGTPSLMDVLSAHRSQPPVLRRRRRRAADPVDRPPEPVRRGRPSQSRSSGRSNRGGGSHGATSARGRG